MSVGFIAFVTVLHIIGKVWPPRFVLHDAFQRTASLSASVCVLHQPTSLYLLALGVQMYHPSLLLQAFQADVFSVYVLAVQIQGG